TASLNIEAAPWPPIACEKSTSEITRKQIDPEIGRVRIGARLNRDQASVSWKVARPASSLSPCRFDEIPHAHRIDIGERAAPPLERRSDETAIRHREVTLDRFSGYARTDPDGPVLYGRRDALDQLQIGRRARGDAADDEGVGAAAV